MTRNRFVRQECDLAFKIRHSWMLCMTAGKINYRKMDA